MTRYLAMIGLLGFAAPVLAQDLKADAWGLADPADLDRAAWAGARIAAAGESATVTPLFANDILLFVGQKSLVAGQDTGQAAALVLDRNGNLVMDGTTVQITLDNRKFPTTVVNGIADHLFESTRAGHYHAGAATQQMQSNRAEYDIIPDLLSVVPTLVPDDGQAMVEAFHDFESQPLKDRYGNLLLGGTSTNFRLVAQNGSISVLPGQVVNGAGTTRLLARDIGLQDALSGQFSAMVGVTVSQPAPYVIMPVQASAPLDFQLTPVDDLGLVRMVAGPFLSDAGYYLNDGAPVVATARLSDGSSLVQDAWVQDGRVVIDWLMPKDTSLTTISVESPLGRANHTVPQPMAPQP